MREESLQQRVGEPWRVHLNDESGKLATELVKHCSGHGSGGKVDLVGIGGWSFLSTCTQNQLELLVIVNGLRRMHNFPPKF